VGSRILYRNTGGVLARATTDPSGLKLPDGIDLDGDGVVGPGRHGSGGATRSGRPYGSPAPRSPSRSTPC
jgi:hypothetical protein